MLIDDYASIAKQALKLKCDNPAERCKTCGTYKGLLPIIGGFAKLIYPCPDCCSVDD